VTICYYCCYVRAAMVLPYCSVGAKYHHDKARCASYEHNPDLPRPYTLEARVLLSMWPPKDRSIIAIAIDLNLPTRMVSGAVGRLYRRGNLTRVKDSPQGQLVWVYRLTKKLGG
jgi:hypothetical protein